MIHFVLLISRQGKVRLTKWYSATTAKDKARTVREVLQHFATSYNRALQPADPLDVRCMAPRRAVPAARGPLFASVRSFQACEAIVFDQLQLRGECAKMHLSR